MTKAYCLAVCATSFLLASPTDAHADLCGGDSWGGRTSSIQAKPSYTVQILAQTNVVHLSGHPFCHGDFYARAALTGGGNCPQASSTEHHTTLGENTLALAQKQCAGLSTGVEYKTHGTHGGFETTETESDSPNSVTFAVDNDNDGYDESQDCDDNDPNHATNCTDADSDGHYWDEDCDDQDPNVWEFCEYTPPDSPIVFDLSGNGFDLTDTARGVEFDLNADGVSERIAWTAGGEDDAWLALDRNSNGTIDNGRELFGSYTDQPPSTNPHGFLALLVYDEVENGGNNDGWIDAEDAVFRSLVLWRDSNHDGLSQAGELMSLAEGGVVRVSLRYQRSFRLDRWGNAFRYRARVVSDRGSDIGPWAYDVFLAAVDRR